MRTLEWTKAEMVPVLVVFIVIYSFVHLFNRNYTMPTIFSGNVVDPEDTSGWE